MLFFVSGITGHTGGTAAATLLQQGHTVRTVARDPAKAQSWADRGVDVRKGDWNDSAALADALRGVDGASLMMSPSQTPSRDFREAKALVASYREALTQKLPPKLVLLSSFGSEQTSGIGLITSTHLLEQAVGDLDTPTAILRPGGFFQNYVPQIKPTEASGVLYSFYQPVDRKLLMQSTEDIGKEIAQLLTTEWTGRRVIEIGTETSPAEIAAAMGKALGKPITAQAVPRDHWSGALQQFGMPAEFTWAFEEMVDAINSGRIHNNVQGTEKVPATITPEAFFAQAVRN